MDTDREFDLSRYPPFSSEGEPCAELDTLNLVALQQDEAQRTRLFEVCRSKGFFYLDLAGSDFASLPTDALRICTLAQDFFRRPQEEKEKYAYGVPGNESIFGYKRAGHTKTDIKGTPDTAEFLNVSKDIILGNHGATTCPLPSFLLDHPVRGVLARYQNSCHSLGAQILSILAEQLGLPRDIFDETHRLDQPSGDHIRMTRGPPRRDPNAFEIQTPGHTDFGEITILFNWLGGLQVWSEGCRGDFHNCVDPGPVVSDGRSEQLGWLYVPPRQGCAIINLGDAMVHYTGGILCSGRHRVVPAPGAQGRWPRYSIVYFVRPENNTKLKRIEGAIVPPRDRAINVEDDDEQLTAKQWIMRQATKMAEGVQQE